MLEIRSLGYHYKGAQYPALSGVTVAAKRGGILGLLGPNGAGKTTLISHLSGALEVQLGSILVDGVPLEKVRRRTPTRIAVAPQQEAFYPMLTVAENMAVFAAAGRLNGTRKRSRIEECMALGQLERFADVRAAKLSGGLKRRLNLAITLLPQPELVLFDEPTVGVDAQSRAFVLDAIRRLADEGAAVIYASHYMEEIEAIAERVAILDHGRVIRIGPLTEMLSEGARVLTLKAPDLHAQALQPYGKPERSGGHWRLELDDNMRPTYVLKALEEAGFDVQQAEFGRASLEQLFMSLTQRSLRDS